MNGKRTRAIVLRIAYPTFLTRRMRHKLLPCLELDASDRPFRLFTLDNDVIGARVRALGAHEPEVLAAFSTFAALDRRHGGVALDIGANIGNHAVRLARLFPRVIAFEPNPIMAAALRANALLNDCKSLDVVECGLSDRQEDALLRQRVAGHSGTLELTETGDMLGPLLPESRIHLERGDDVLESMLQSGEHVAFVKIDVEGLELAALRGLATVLARDKPVICFEVRDAVEGNPVRRLLESCGYTHFGTISATRLGPGTLLRLFRRDTWFKTYAITPVREFENRHYPAVFASVDPLP